MNTFTTVPQVITALQTVAAKGTEWEAIFNNPQEAIKALKAQPAKKAMSKDMRVYDTSPVRDAIWQMQRVMSKSSAHARGLVGMGKLDAPIAAQALDAIHQQFEMMRAHLAAHTRTADGVLSHEDVTITVQAGDFDEMRAQSPTADLYELVDGETQVLEDSYESSAHWDAEMQDNGDSSTKAAKPSESETTTIAAMHTAWDALLLEHSRTRWSDSLYAEAAFEDTSWPDHDLWEGFTERMASAALNSVDYAKGAAAKADAKEKGRKRCYVLTTPFEDSKLKPYTRWAINAGMRRIWRDRQVLAGRLEAYITQLSDMEAAAFDEERTNAPANWYSLVLARPEPRETSLMYFDVSENELWDNVRGSVLSKEAAWCEGIGFEGENYKSITNGTSQVHMAEWEGNTPKIEHESRWINYLIEKLEELIQGLDSLYAELGVVEQAGSYLWKWRSEAPKVDSFNSPPTPPVYWNLKGFYLTEEDALVALEAEFEDLSEKLAADEGDAFERAFLANMVMHGVGGGA